METSLPFGMWAVAWGRRGSVQYKPCFCNKVGRAQAA